LVAQRHAISLGLGFIETCQAQSTLLRRQELSVVVLCPSMFCCVLVR
jgi:hypothetical protein